MIPLYLLVGLVYIVHLGLEKRLFKKNKWNTIPKIIGNTIGLFGILIFYPITILTNKL